MKQRLIKRSATHSPSSDFMLPVMSLLLITISFLLGNLGFLQLYSSPVRVGDKDTTVKPAPVVAQLKIHARDQEFFILNGSSGETLEHQTLHSAKKLERILRAEINKYPSLDAVIVSVDLDVSYDTVMRFLPVFHKVPNRFEIVLMPKEAS